MNQFRNNKIPKYFYRRRLPHWQPPGAILFITWRCYGSLPDSAIRKLNLEKQKLQNQPIKENESKRDQALRHSKKLFALSDKLLHSDLNRSSFFGNSSVADMIVDSLFHHDEALYDLHAFIVMPNHVHLLIQPQFKGWTDNQEIQYPDYEKLDHITHSIKSYTAQKGNEMLDRVGKSFWQEEQYDHWVRDGEEYTRITDYIESDPVRSGLVDEKSKWKWSSVQEKHQGRMTDFEFQWID